MLPLSAATDDPFIFRRRLLVLVIFCVAIINTALLVPSEQFSDSFLKTTMKVFAVIVGLSISVVCLLWVCGRILVGADDSNDSRVDAETSRIESTYDSLSKRQKKHLDRIRSDAIRALLANFTMKLRQDNMTNLTTSRVVEAAESEELLEHQIIPIEDEEEGGCDERGDNNYAHLMIHRQHQNLEEDKNSLTREVPNSCAICLIEYEVSDIVSWSANPQCPHIFHEQCIAKWFLSLGRLQTICDISLEDECAKNVLNYRLECPCCRQDFIPTKD